MTATDAPAPVAPPVRRWTPDQLAVAEAKGFTDLVAKLRAAGLTEEAELPQLSREEISYLGNNNPLLLSQYDAAGLTRAAQNEPAPLPPELADGELGIEDIEALHRAKKYDQINELRESGALDKAMQGATRRKPADGQKSREWLQERYDARDYGAISAAEAAGELAFIQNRGGVATAEAKEGEAPKKATWAPPAEGVQWAAGDIQRAWALGPRGAHLISAAEARGDLRAAQGLEVADAAVDV